MNIQGKTALVTGASKGIGKAIAEALAHEGGNVIVHYYHDEPAAQKLVADCQKLSVKAMRVKADIASETEVTAMFEQIKPEFPTIDILVNNAGIFDENDSPENLDVFHRVFDANFFGPVNVTKHARAMMDAGKIVFISSVHGIIGHGSPDAIAYSASKAALESYVKNLAKDAAPKVLVNAVAPGRTLTPMWGDMSEKEVSSLAAGHLTERWIQPEEIADAVSFLIKNDSVCGEILVVDGGMSLKTLG